MKRKTYLWLGLAVALALLAGAALVQASADHQVLRKVLSAGGGSRSAADFRARDTAGQSAVGVSQGGDNRVRAGLWARPMGPSVAFPDPNLEAAIREALGKPSGDITVAELAGLTSLPASGRSIADLTGLEHAINLTVLNLWNNQVSDLSPLSSLTKLTELVLRENRVSDLSPLSSLISLTKLILAVNQISDISALVENSGLGTGDVIDLRNNKLDLWEGSKDLADIRALQSRGATVQHDPIGSPPLPGDVTRDGKVDVQDLVAVASAFNTTSGHPGYSDRADVNDDGVVNIFDLALVGWNFGRTSSTYHLVYSTDFSSDPQWVTSNSSKFYWDQAGQRYRYQLVGGSSDYTYVPVSYNGGSFRLSFDLKPTRTDFAASHVFGISNPNLNTGEIAGKPKIFVRYASDVGGVHFWLYAYDDAGQSLGSTEGLFSNNVTYRNVITYSPGQASIVVTRLDTGETVKTYTLTGLGTFTGMNRLYSSVEGIGGGNTGAVAEGYVDNVELSSFTGA